MESDETQQNGYTTGCTSHDDQWSNTKMLARGQSPGSLAGDRSLSGAVGLQRRGPAAGGSMPGHGLARWEVLISVSSCSAVRPSRGTRRGQRRAYCQCVLVGMMWQQGSKGSFSLLSLTQACIHHKARSAAQPEGLQPRPHKSVLRGRRASRLRLLHLLSVTRLPVGRPEPEFGTERCAVSHSFTTPAPVSIYLS